MEMEKDKAKVREIKTFDDWKSNMVGSIDFKREDGFVDRFVCRGLTGKDLDEINEACKYPVAPVKPRLGSDNRPIVKDGLSLTENDENDPDYINAKDEMDKKRIVMTLERCLVSPPGKEIPGKNYHEKLENLNTKLRGDLNNLVSFIQTKLSNLRPMDIGFFG